MGAAAASRGGAEAVRRSSACAARGPAQRHPRSGGQQPHPAGAHPPAGGYNSKWALPALDEASVHTAPAAGASSKALNTPACRRPTVTSLDAHTQDINTAPRLAQTQVLAQLAAAKQHVLFATLWLGANDAAMPDRSA